MGGEGVSTIKQTRSIRNIALNQSVRTISLRALSICQNWPARPWLHFEDEIGFSQEFLLSVLLRAYYLGFDCSGWRVLIKREIIIATGMV